MYVNVRSPDGAILKIPLYTTKTKSYINPDGFIEVNVDGLLYYVYLYADQSMWEKAGTWYLKATTDSGIVGAGYAYAKKTVNLGSGKHYVSTYTSIDKYGYPKILAASTQAYGGSAGGDSGAGGGNGGARWSGRVRIVTRYYSGGGAGGGASGFSGGNVKSYTYLSVDTKVSISDYFDITVGGYGLGAAASAQGASSNPGSDGGLSVIKINGSTVFASKGATATRAYATPGTNGGPASAKGVGGPGAGGSGALQENGRNNAGIAGRSGSESTSSFPAGGEGGAGGASSPLLSGGVLAGGYGGAGGKGGTGSGFSTANGGSGGSGGGNGLAGGANVALEYVTKLLPV